MPTEYKRKSTERGKWSSSALEEAVKKVKNGGKVLTVAKEYGIPRSTLQNRLKSGITTKGALGPQSQLGPEVEAKIVMHIKNLQAKGFAPDRKSVREMAFRLAKALNIKTKFNEESGLAGFPWFNSFLRRNPSLRIRKAEGFSRARTTGMNRKDVGEYFDLLRRTLTDNDLIGKPGSIYNMDETGLQLNNKPGKVVAAKGSISVPSVTSGERGETITVMACANAEGTFLPPFSIFKGKNRKEEWVDGMPPGSDYIMSEKSAYVTASIFTKWLQCHFIPRKPPGKVILVLDGHTSHTNDVSMLQFAEENEIILLGFPSHTTHFLQPLDRSFFKSLKSHWNNACNSFVRNMPSRKINRAVFGQLLGQAWSKAATVQNGAHGFKATGIYPLNPDIIPDYAFLTDDPPSTTATEQVPPILVRTELAVNTSTAEQVLPFPVDSELAQNASATDVQPNPPSSVLVTPGKLLLEISPVPEVRTNAADAPRACVRQLAQVFNSQESVEKLRTKMLNKQIKQEKAEERKKKRALREEMKTNMKSNKKRKAKKKHEEESECEDIMSLHDDSLEEIEWDEDVDKEEEPLELKEGVFVLVKVSGTSSTSFRVFVAKIIKKFSHAFFEVRFYKKADKVLKFTETDEENYAQIDDIILTLSSPVVASSARYRDMIGFSTDLSEYVNVLG